MTKEHMEILLNNIVNHITSANDTVDSITELYNLGFDREDLLYFGFSENELDDYDG